MIIVFVLLYSTSCFLLKSAIWYLICFSVFGASGKCRVQSAECRVQSAESRFADRRLLQNIVYVRRTYLLAITRPSGRERTRKHASPPGRTNCTFELHSMTNLSGMLMAWFGEPMTSSKQHNKKNNDADIMVFLYVFFRKGIYIIAFPNWISTFLRSRLVLTAQQINGFCLLCERCIMCINRARANRAVRTESLISLRKTFVIRRKIVRWLVIWRKIVGWRGIRRKSGRLPDSVREKSNESNYLKQPIFPWSRIYVKLSLFVPLITFDWR